MGVDRLIRRIRLSLLPWLHKSPPGPILFVRHLSYKDIKKATDGFHRIIYCNSHGTAYKARFQDGGVALVKEVTAFSQELDVFYREVQLLGRLHHRHLLPLRGFSTGNKRVLIFDSIENGSLKEHLSDPLKTPLNWRTRLQIAIGVAAALEYLLLFSDLPMYHVSITSSSIMLDENFTAKLSDVSLLSSGGNYVTVPHSSSSEECAVQERGNLILQLGVLILELITGQCSEEGGADLIQWVQGSRFASSMHQMIDPDLGNDYNSSELKKLLAVATLCLKSGDKPMFSIPQILHYVQKKLDVSRD
ncbi:probable receptor-like protein kinase At1g49730 [Corylus avellana]|uniref:probable receptor-like protein kinase At1g49730 n=1 Tax=Corylus avellana TaxID=13451 RepID=UPI00286B5E47|nr:probable receptor-like protein kinase At1g49730 [Corylus avellana]